MRKELDFDLHAPKLNEKKSKDKGKQIMAPRKTRYADASHATRTQVLSVFSTLVHQKFKDDNHPIEYPFDDNVFGQPNCRTFVSLSDCQCVLTMDWLTNSVIDIFSS